MKCSRLDCDNDVATGPGTTGKFCSKSCAAKVNNVARAKKRYCLSCDIRLTKYSQKKYCSVDCSRQGRTDEYISRWIQGLENGSDTSGELKNRIRKHLLLAAGGACTKCGWSVPNPVTGKVILTIDHIDGNWQNNHRDNLVVLCYNCHTLTPTFGSLNKGKGVVPRSVGSRRH